MGLGWGDHLKTKQKQRQKQEKNIEQNISIGQKKKLKEERKISSSFWYGLNSTQKYIDRKETTMKKTTRC
jgi:hypothetical protein